MSASHICDGIYIGDVDFAGDEDGLNLRKIDAIVNCTKCIPNYFEHLGAKMYMRVPIDDSPSQDIEPYFESTFEFIDKRVSQGKPMLVHCAAGISRSVSIVIAYLIKKKGMSCDDAYTFVQQKRPQASPRLEFVVQLRRIKPTGHLR